MPEALKDKVQEIDLEFLGAVPADQQLAEFEFSGEPLVQLGDDSPVYQAVAAMLKTIIE